jgi:3'-5' exoribonuclease
MAVKKQWVKDLRDGSPVETQFVIRAKTAPVMTRSGKYYFNFTVGDRTGSVRMNYWGGMNFNQITRLYQSFNIGDVVDVKGVATEHPDYGLTINIQEGIDYVKKSIDFKIDDFLPVSERNRDVLFETISNTVKSIENTFLKKLLTCFFEDPEFVRAFKESPAAVKIHHSYVGGHLEHTVNVVNICNALCDAYSILNKDLLITGAILHDIGKLLAYSCTTTIELTTEGKLIGDLVIADRLVRDKIKSIDGFPYDLELNLMHLILSHHTPLRRYRPLQTGASEFVYELQTPEAVALHYADELDARLNEFLQKTGTQKLEKEFVEESIEE